MNDAIPAEGVADPAATASISMPFSTMGLSVVPCIGLITTFVTEEPVDVCTIVRSDGQDSRDVFGHVGAAVAESVSNTDVLVDHELVAARVNARAEALHARALNRNVHYAVNELLQSENGGRVRLSSVQRNGEDAVAAGLAELDGQGVTFFSHGIYALRYTVTSKDGAARTGYLYGEVLR